MAAYEFEANATFSKPVKGKLTDQAVCMNADRGEARRAIGDWVTRTLAASPVGTKVDVFEVKRVLDASFEKREPVT